MAKNNPFWQNINGKLGNAVYSSRNGQQVARAYVPRVSNRRTYLQTFQRSSFANVVAFFKTANQRLFPLAYEDKRRNESDYNAFMRHNSKRGVFMLKEQNDNVFVPKIGNYLLTVGQLPNVPVRYEAGTDPEIALAVEASDIVPGAGAYTTIGTISKVLMRNYNSLQVGDIVTYVQIGSDAQVLSVAPYIQAGLEAPRWKIDQFALDPSSTEMCPIIMDEMEAGATSITLNEIGSQIEMAIIISRKTSTKLLVSTTALVAKEYVQQAIDVMSPDFTDRTGEDVWKQMCLESYNVGQEVILEGSLIEPAVVAEPEFATIQGFGSTIASLAEFVPNNVGSSVGEYPITGRDNYIQVNGTNMRNVRDDGFVDIQSDFGAYTMVEKTDNHVILKVPANESEPAGNDIRLYYNPTAGTTTGSILIATAVWEE